MFLTISCGGISNKSLNVEDEISIKVESKTMQNTFETIKYDMFCKALNCSSTAPYYLVVTVKNLNTDEIKEICTEAPFLHGAIDRQKGTFSNSIDCNDYPNRYFEFSKDSSLRNINFNLYTTSDLEQYAKELDIEETVRQIVEEGMNEKVFWAETKEEWANVKKQQIMFAHLMFNNGIMVRRGCVAGNICELTLYDEVEKNSEK